MAFTLAHLSDVHLGPLPEFSRRKLLSKRITGYINWQRNRARIMDNYALAALEDALTKIRPGHIAVTGDLTNLALPEEFAATTAWLENLGAGRDVSVIPGNHDAYVRGALQQGLSDWAPFMTNDDGTVPKINGDFPYMRRREKIMIIGVSSAIATPAFVAAGRFGRAQEQRVRALLAQGKREGLFRVILIHHPPVRAATRPAKRLYGIKLFQNMIADVGAELVLHGHTHLPQRHEIPGPNDTIVPVIGVPSASQIPGGHNPAATYNLFEIDGQADDWRCRLTAYTVTGPAQPLRITDSRTLRFEA